MNGETTSTYTTNNLNQYTEINGISRSHSENGNLLQDGDYKYNYDFLNRLVRVTGLDDMEIARYTYDSNGRRMSKTFWTAMQGNTYHAFYQGAGTQDCQMEKILK